MTSPLFINYIGMQLGYLYGVGALHVLFYLPVYAQLNSWAVKITGGLEVANDIARRNGFVNQGQVNAQVVTIVWNAERFAILN